MKEVAACIMASHGYSERRACRLTRQSMGWGPIDRSTQRRKMVSDPLTELRQRMHEIVTTRIRYGYRRAHTMLKREGWTIGRNRVYRVCRAEGLALKTKRPRRRKMATHREARCRPKAPNEAWSLDFVHDRLSNGQKIRALTIIDVCTRECLAIEVGYRLRGENVVEVLNRLVRFRGAPKSLFADNGAEFTGRMVDLRAYHNKARVDFSRPARPTDNAHIESFNGALRDERLNVHWFETLAEAKREIEAWRREDNEVRPHMAPGDIPPAEYALQARNCRAKTEKSAVGI